MVMMRKNFRFMFPRYIGLWPSYSVLLLVGSCRLRVGSVFMSCRLLVGCVSVVCRRMAVACWCVACRARARATYGAASFDRVDM